MGATARMAIAKPMGLPIGSAIAMKGRSAMGEWYLGAHIRNDDALQIDLFFGLAHYRRVDRPLPDGKWQIGPWKRLPSSYAGQHSTRFSYERYGALQRLASLSAVTRAVKRKQKSLWAVAYYRADDGSAKARAA